MDRLMMEKIQATWSVCVCVCHLRILPASKAALYPPRAVKIFKVCGVLGGLQGERGRRGGGCCTEVTGKAPTVNVPPPDIFRGIYSHSYSSLLFWEFMHTHYFTWLKYPPKHIASFRVQIQLVWWSDDGPLKATHAPWTRCRRSLVSLFSLFVSMCLEGTTTGDTQGDRSAHFCVIWLGPAPAWHSLFLVFSLSSVHRTDFPTEYVPVLCCLFIAGCCFLLIMHLSDLFHVDASTEKGGGGVASPNVTQPEAW